MKMNVLSLFDGIGGAKLALDSNKFDVINYFSSEIDKYAIKVLDKNFSNITHLGDIREINHKKLPKIDLLIGGSPCQDLSIAQKGDGLKGKKSNLFYDYVNLLKSVKPKYFLLENVINKWSNKMGEELGVYGVKINSNLFSAQNRPRMYWSNIDFDKLPTQIKDTNLSSLIDDNVDEKYFLDSKKSSFINGKKLNTNKSKDGIIKLITAEKEFIRDNERQRRIYSIDGKSPTLLARSDSPKILINDRIRKLTPLECERLQGFPDNWTGELSDTQRYKLIGNAFSVEVISYILKFLKKKPTSTRNIITLYDKVY